jgi:hypothetical protein
VSAGNKVRHGEGLCIAVKNQKWMKARQCAICVSTASAWIAGVGSVTRGSLRGQLQQAHTHARTHACAPWCLTLRMPESASTRSLARRSAYEISALSTVAAFFFATTAASPSSSSVPSPSPCSSSPSASSSSCSDNSPFIPRLLLPPLPLLLPPPPLPLPRLMPPPPPRPPLLLLPPRLPSPPLPLPPVLSAAPAEATWRTRSRSALRNARPSVSTSTSPVMTSADDAPCCCCSLACHRP